MKRGLGLFGFAALAAVGALALAAMQLPAKQLTRTAEAQEGTSLRDLAGRATGSDSSAADEAVAGLRAAGPAGLAALMDANAEAIRYHRDGGVSKAAANDSWARVCKAIDRVAAQKDAWASGLYWYTDLEAAKSVAKQSGKPILSLRLLGTLDTEYSCANSRFFRTVLYANAEVSQTLSDRFVLHWQSVRPVPKVTIDFGDGRVVERTITGNSIHYVLSADGTVIDGIPGLYGPKDFLRLLNTAAKANAAFRSDVRGAGMLRHWHTAQAGRIARDWQNDLQSIGAIAPPAEAKGKSGGHPTAVRAAGRAVGKSAGEMRLVVAIAPDVKAMEAASTQEVWVKVAAMHADAARLDATSRAVIASKNPAALESEGLVTPGSSTEGALTRIVQNFERAISEDSVRNEFTFHRQIHLWLASGKLPDGKAASDLAALNERVYADLFLTPSSDPWLGLLPADTYSALVNDGVCRKR
ncbi:MAG: hypothetical protein JWN51_1720 [Phycisphaerales bacterium]|nr:hypothetical protein [Phycisphaerales bacterium]